MVLRRWGQFYPCNTEDDGGGCELYEFHEASYCLQRYMRNFTENLIYDLCKIVASDPKKTVDKAGEALIATQCLVGTVVLVMMVLLWIGGCIDVVHARGVDGSDLVKLSRSHFFYTFKFN